MPANPDANDIKEALWETIEAAAGRFEKVDRRRPHWRVSAEQQCSVFIAYSCYHPRNDWYFYGLFGEDLQRWAGFPRSFVVFLLETTDNALIIPIPVRLLLDLLPLMYSDQVGQSKFNIVRTPSFHFAQAPRVSLAQFHNNYAQLVPGKSPAA